MEFVPICHGGVWIGDTYEGGSKEYILVPDGGISFEELLCKIEVRMQICRKTTSFDVYSLVEVAPGTIGKIKITDEVEWCCLRKSFKLPTVYVSVRKISDVLSDAGSIGSASSTNCDDVGIDRCILSTFSCNRSVSSISNCQTLIPAVESTGVYEKGECSGNSRGSDLVKGSYFLDKDALVAAVSLYHLKIVAEYYTKRSDKERYHLVCKYVDTCPFVLRAKAFVNIWTVKVLKTHTCVLDLTKAPVPKVSIKALAAHVGPKLTVDGFEVRPKDIQGQVLRDFGVDVKYSTALAGRNFALYKLHGTYDESFQLLPSYLYMLEQSNAGSVVDLQTKEDNSFEYCYFALDACVKAFRACRPVIVIDATHLKGKYKGVMFIATTKDSNEQIVPLAFCVGDKENDISWCWFLQRVRQSFGVREGMLIVSDQHQSIRNAVESVFPGVAHGICTYHIQGNLRQWGEDVIDVFQQAASAYREDDFDSLMSKLETDAPGAHAKLLNIDPIRWAKCKCPVRRYNFGTSNAVECFNGRIVWARKLPICRLLEYTRNLVQDWFYKRRKKVAARTLEYSEYAMKRLENAVRAGRFMKVEPISDSKFRIISEVKSYVVDIAARTCSCEVFQRDLIPCSHATRAICFSKQNPCVYVNAYYSSATWLQVYAAEVMPVSDPVDWRVPDVVASRVVRTPANPRQAGRPRLSRADVGDRVCSRCKQSGHLRNKCKTLMEIDAIEEVCIPQSGLKRRRKPKKCGICGVVGHTRRKCNDPNRF